MKLKGFCALSLALLLTLSGCNFFSKKEEPSAPESEVELDPNYPVTISGEQTVEIKPERVVSLSAGLVEKIYDLELEEVLVGVPDFTTYPPSATELESCGTSLLVDQDAIEEVGADVILTETPLSEDLEEWLEDHEIQVIVLESPNTLEDLWTVYEDLALVLSGAEEGPTYSVPLIQKMQDWLFDTKQATFSQEPVTALYVRQLDFNIATGDTLVGDLLQEVGFLNIGQEEKNWIYPKEKAESAEGKEAFQGVDLLFFDGKDSSVEEFEQNAFYKTLPCVTKDQYLPIDCTAFERSGGSMLGELEKMVQHAWPEAKIPTWGEGSRPPENTEEQAEVEIVRDEETIEEPA